ncbi:hypothetical protein HON22_00675, partial [Candidatus Peregrinibacteria bacterium]|nr:hypothetical protein [Candidatus Peregrinibacteria bacterium]
RIVGPFTKEQIGELVLKGHVSGGEDFQVFPGGEWEALEKISDLGDYLYNIISEKTVVKKNISDTILNLDIKNQIDPLGPQEAEAETAPAQTEEDHFIEFKYKKVSTLRKSKDSEESEESLDQTIVDDVSEDSYDSGPIDKTRVLKVPSKHDSTVEKTRVIKLEESEVIEEIPPQEETESHIHEPDPDIVDTDAQTQMVRVNELLPELKKESHALEREIDKLEEEERSELEKSDEDITRTKVDTLLKKKGTKPIVAIAFIVVIFFALFDDDGEDKPIIPKTAKIVFPVTYDQTDELKSKEAFRLGKEHLKKYIYTSQILAADQFKISLEHKFKNNPAQGYLLRTYANLFFNASNKSKAASNLFKLIQITRSKILKDENVAIGSAIFYFNSDKHATAKRVIENFIRVSKKKSLTLFSVYLNILIELGEFDKASRVFKSLYTYKGKLPLKGYLSVVRYLKEDQRFDDAKKFIEKAVKYYPRSVALLLEYVHFILRDKDFKKLKNILLLIKNLQAESNPLYYSKYLEGLGFLSVVKGDNKTAAKQFRLALKIHESHELRSKLASLELGGPTGVESLIKESKVIELINKAKTEMRKKNWDKAFQLAIDASDLYEEYIPAQLLLSEIEVKRGFFTSASKKLEGLQGEFPLNFNINYRLIMAYIKARKLDEAQEQIAKLSNTDLRKNPHYKSLLARYY